MTRDDRPGDPGDTEGAAGERGMGGFAAARAAEKSRTIVSDADRGQPVSTGNPGASGSVVSAGPVVELEESLNCANLSAVRGEIKRVLTTFPRDFVHDVQLVAIELAANACDHADDPRHLVLRRVDQDGNTMLLIEAHDATPERLPVVGVSRIDPLRGNGMKMVQALCEDWGVRASHGDAPQAAERAGEVNTKIVWALLPIPA